MNPNNSFDQPAMYRFEVLGKLTEEWRAYFEELEIAVMEDGNGLTTTVIQGELADQSAVQGILKKVYILGLPLLKVEKMLE